MGRRLKIACDIDDVILEYVATLTQFYNKVYDENLQTSDVHCWDLKTIYEKASTPEATKALMDSFVQHPTFTTMPEVPGATASIRRLIDEGHELYFISARGSKAIDSCYRWFYEHNLPLKNIYFNRDKAWLVDKLGIEVFIDDGMHNLNDIGSKTQATTIVFDRPWNRQAPATTAHYRAKDWPQVLNILRECV